MLLDPVMDKFILSNAKYFFIVPRYKPHIGVFQTKITYSCSFGIKVNGSVKIYLKLLKYISVLQVVD